MTEKERIKQALCAMEQIIAPEIFTGRWYKIITELTLTGQFKTVLEIGASSGDGSTMAIVRGLCHHPANRLFCLEPSRVRFKKLASRYKNNAQIKCYNMCSTNRFMSREDLIDFYRIVLTNKNTFTLDTVLGWYGGDIAYAKIANIKENGIEFIKQEQGIVNFDMVIIDGSGYNSRDEFKLLYGAKCFVLDNINSTKNYLNYYDLASDPNYILIEQDWKARGKGGGYAVFRHVPYQTSKQFDIPPFNLNCQGIQKTLSAKPLEQIYGDLIYRVQDHIATCKECHLFMERQK